jgi:hypothetical protein
LPVEPGYQPGVPNGRQVAGRNGLVTRSTRYERGSAVYLAIVSANV